MTRWKLTKGHFKPSLPLPGSPDTRLPAEAVPPPVRAPAARLQVNKAPGDFIALLGFVPLCYWPRLNLLPWRQEPAQPELPRRPRRSGGTVTLSGCLA